MHDDHPASRRESGDDRRLAIAAAARELIVEKGIEGLRTRDIAARVGINIATLHYHVPSKEALITLVAASIRDEFRAQSMRRPRTDRDGLTQLRMEFEDFYENIVETPELIAVLTELLERARRDEAIYAIMAPLNAFWRDQFADIFRLGSADGSFRPDIDPVAAALIVTGALVAFGRIKIESRVGFAQFTAELERSFTLRTPA